MDLKKIGEFLAQLRKEKNLTQEQLGEKLGVSNKTVSRWENGNYLPPVEMLQSLSDLYGITINEILSCERLGETEYKEKAEENIKSVLQNSGFTLKEKMDFYKNKWRRDHLVSGILCWLGIFGLLLAGLILDNGLHLVAMILGFAYYIIQRNRMMIYIEDHAFDGSGNH